MKPEDLDDTDKFFLKFCRDKPLYQYIGEDRTKANTLAAFGLIRYAGNMQFEITEDGEDILNELDAQETSEEIPLLLQDNRLSL